jgi:hypothetical protein
MAPAIAVCVVLVDVISSLLTVPGRAPHSEQCADTNSGWLTPELVGVTKPTSVPDC